MLSDVDRMVGFWLFFGILVFLLRREIAAEWRASHPRRPRFPRPAGGHWRIRRRK